MNNAKTSFPKRNLSSRMNRYQTSDIQTSDISYSVNQLFSKSRSDDTLLTVDAIYGQNGQYRLQPKSRRGRYFTVPVVSSLRDFAACVPCQPLRRLKSTVNKVPSLRDCKMNNE